MKIHSNLHLYLNVIVGLCLMQPLVAQIQRLSTEKLNLQIQGPDYYTSYIRHSMCRASDPIRYPKTVEDVVGTVTEAIDRGVKVKAFGQRHSITDIICTDGIPIDMRSFKSLEVNEDETSTFGAGVTIQEAGEFLLHHKRALRFLPAYGNITLVGAIGTGAHGSSIKFHSSLSAQVVKMTIVNGLGKVMVISSRKDLRSFRVHLGLLGNYDCQMLHHKDKGFSYQVYSIAYRYYPRRNTKHRSVIQNTIPHFRRIRRYTN